MKGIRKEGLVSISFIFNKFFIDHFLGGDTVVSVVGGEARLDWIYSFGTIWSLSSAAFLTLFCLGTILSLEAEESSLASKSSLSDL